MTVVLDASALLAYLRQEPGAEEADGLICCGRSRGSEACRWEIAFA